MKSMYPRLGIALGVSLLVMFCLSLAQTRRWDHFYFNISNFYLSLMMVGAMGVVMLLVMRPMYTNKRLNAGLLVTFAATLVTAFVLGRTETFVGDEAFLHSMIPHHSRAILVCQEASLTDPEIIELCDGIIETQREEIAEMQRILEEY
ncbi:DUF305 domain-containing protein [uncultured Cellulomonas sp.]|uniref:DUF305 domain-containing protein n=1 Tax=uncultured Cellulomonas sp. TaxID=189682 RepID=UPI002617A229|nr:DUF305 domain-containing protein [uncultured Cellulomonas sp.]